MKRLGIVLATTIAFGGAAFLSVGANAQEGVTPAQPPSPNAQPSPPLPGQGTMNPGIGRGPGSRQGGPRGLGRFSPEDRAAFFDAHIAAVKAGLELTPSQQQLWPPVEQAVRDLTKTVIEQRQRIAQQGRPTDPIERLRSRADFATARGAALRKVADAAQPLWASLNDDQKRRLPILMRGMEARNEMRRGGEQGGWRERMRERMRDMMQRRFAPGGGDDRQRD